MKLTVNSLKKCSSGYPQGISLPISDAVRRLFGSVLKNLVSLSSKNGSTNRAPMSIEKTWAYQGAANGVGQKLRIGAAVLLLPICGYVPLAHTSNGRLNLEREPTIVASLAALKMEQLANAVERKSSSIAITSNHFQNFQNQDSILRTAKSFAPNATILGIYEKLGELLEHPFGKISSQAPHVALWSGAAKVQRLGGEDNNNPPKSARRESDEIVWTAWQHADVGHKQASDNTSVIYSISPTETPFFTMASRVEASAVLHEWQTDALTAAAANKQVEGDDAANGTSTPTSRLGMYCQIAAKYAIVSDTQQAVDKAGRASEMSYQVAKRLGELKRDMEFAALNHQGSSAGSATVARSTASVESWLTTPTGASMAGNSTDIGSGGGYTTPGWTSGGSILAPTDSSNNGTIVVGNLKKVISDCWVAGGNPGVVMSGATVKQQISGFAGIATIYREAGNTAKGTAIVGAADLYISDFGEHRVVPNRFTKTNQVLVLDMDYWKIGYLRKVSQKEIARTGAATKRFIDVEFCVVASNPQSSGKISSVVP